MNEYSTDVSESQASSTPPTSPLSDQTLLVGDADTTQPGKLFSGDRGLPRSTSIQASQLWPTNAQDDSGALVHQCMTSCPDFSRDPKQPGVNGALNSFTVKQANGKPTKRISPRLGSWHHLYSRRVSRSQPITPPTFRERIAVRFRRRRPWESPRRSRNSPSAELVMPRFQDGRERRRRARGSLERHSPSDIGSPRQCTPVEE
ncbi:hypothetical protein ACQKWADRAFT_285966 [Trichoderma austrokoningii]